MNERIQQLAKDSTFFSDLVWQLRDEVEYLATDGRGQALATRDPAAWRFPACFDFFAINCLRKTIPSLLPSFEGITTFIPRRRLIASYHTFDEGA